jgi:hypothetical protein
MGVCVCVCVFLCELLSLALPCSTTTDQCIDGDQWSVWGRCSYNQQSSSRNAVQFNTASQQCQASLLQRTRTCSLSKLVFCVCVCFFLTHCLSLFAPVHPCSNLPAGWRLVGLVGLRPRPAIQQPHSLHRRHMRAGH